MEPKHTPGPWVFDPERTSEGTLLVVTTPTPLGHQEAIAEALKLSVGNTEANARLISAAPEMLEALRAVLDEDRWVNKVHPDCVEIIRAAINKAEGRF